MVNEDAEPSPVNGKKPHKCDESLDYIATWGAMEKLVDNGKCKSIGVSNFNNFQMKRLLANHRIKPVTNQIEANPYLTMVDLINYCQANDVTVRAITPFLRAQSLVIFTIIPYIHFTALNTFFRCFLFFLFS